jgi:hypothetical protein
MGQDIWDRTAGTRHNRWVRTIRTGQQVQDSGNKGLGTRMLEQDSWEDCYQRTVGTGRHGQDSQPEDQAAL